MESRAPGMTLVLDSSVVLAYLLDESGRDIAEATIAAEARISSVNLAEVMGRLVRDGADPATSADVLLALPLIVVPMDAQLAITAGAMIPQTRPLGWTLGDRACPALAKPENVPAVTAHRAWLPARPLVGVEVRLIR
jgi:ribonuclease VapC